MVGIAIGVVALVGYHEALNFGENLVESDKAHPFLGLWLPFLAFLTVSLVAFLRVAQRLSLGNILALGGLPPRSGRRAAPQTSAQLDAPVEEEARRCAS